MNLLFVLRKTSCLFLILLLGTVRAQTPSAARALCSLPESMRQVPIRPCLRPHDLRSYHNQQLLSCDCQAAPPADPKATKIFVHKQPNLDVATKAWVYALMANNTYRNTISRDSTRRIFVIPGWELAARWESSNSLGLEEWTRQGSDGKTAEIVVAFEGTESGADWPANANYWSMPAQFSEAYAYMQCVKQRANGARVVVTCHSLGGAIAQNMSLRIPGVDYFGFDPSPNCYFKVRGRQREAERNIIFEKGEVLMVPRIASLPRFNGIKRHWFDFMNTSTVKNHSMYLLARGLLMMAIKNNDTLARQAFAANISSKDLAAAFATKETDTPEEKAEKEHNVEACQNLLKP